MERYTLGHVTLEATELSTQLARVLQSEADVPGNGEQRRAREHGGGAATSALALKERDESHAAPHGGHQRIVASLETVAAQAQCEREPTLRDEEDCQAAGPGALSLLLAPDPDHEQRRGNHHSERKQPGERPDVARRRAE